MLVTHNKNDMWFPSFCGRSLRGAGRIIVWLLVFTIKCISQRRGCQACSYSKWTLPQFTHSYVKSISIFHLPPFCSLPSDIPQFIMVEDRLFRLSIFHPYLPSSTLHFCQKVYGKLLLYRHIKLIPYLFIPWKVFHFPCYLLYKWSRLYLVPHTRANGHAYQG